MGIPDHLTCLLRNLYASQELTELDVEQLAGSKLGKGYVEVVYCHPALYNLYAEYIMWSAGLDESQAGIKIAERNINKVRYADDATLTEDSEVQLKSLLKVKEKSEMLA